MENLNENNQEKIHGGSSAEDLRGAGCCPVCGIRCVGDPTSEGKIKYFCNNCKLEWWE